jgi:PAS domain S-box-containing protein
LRKYISLPGYEKRALIEIYTRFADKNLSPITLSDENENIIFANEAFCKLIGFSKEEITGKNLRQFTNREEFSTYQVNTELRKRGIASLFESVFIRKDGTQIPVQISASPVQNDEDKLICVMGIITDLSSFLKGSDKDNIHKLNW